MLGKSLFVSNVTAGTFVSIYLCMRVCVYKHVCMCVHMCECLCVCMHVCWVCMCMGHVCMYLPACKSSMSAVGEVFI